jgi:hypothetical protein|tara:strand:+ start:570 stop:902 length:333 start_codon:yes stop_codon:yes gene_type:complete
MVKTNKNSILGTYHTTLRNIGLYSSLAMALLSFSEKGILKKELSNKVLFSLGLVFLMISFVLSKELKDYVEENKKEISKKLTLIAKVINYTLVIFLIMVIYSLLHRYGVL